MFLKPKYCLESIENSISKHLNFKIFWGGMPPDPPRKLALSALEKQSAAYFPNGDVYFKTYWQPCVFDFHIVTPYDVIST